MIKYTMIFILSVFMLITSTAISSSKQEKFIGYLVLFDNAQREMCFKVIYKYIPHNVPMMIDFMTLDGREYNWRGSYLYSEGTKKPELSYFFRSCQ